jgi:hypothetical protein
VTPLVRQDREGPLRRAFSRDGKTWGRRRATPALLLVTDPR